MGVRALLALLGAGPVNEYCKKLPQQPHPYWLGSVHAVSSEATYGFPSGHASGSVSMWGYLALGFKGRWLRIIAIGLVLSGLSRMVPRCTLPT